MRHRRKRERERAVERRGECWQSAASADQRAETKETERERASTQAGLGEEEEGRAAARRGAKEEEKGGRLER